MNQIAENIKAALALAVAAAGLKADMDPADIVIEIPKERRNGDYSSNIAMRLTRECHMNPRVIADRIISELDLEKAGIDHVEVAGPGFMNFYMLKDRLGTILGEVLAADENYGHSAYGQEERVDIEFVSANPTGDLHLGHARGAALGDAICRIMSAAGYDVTREYYINDAGTQITHLAESLIARYHQSFGIDYPLPADGYYGPDVIQIAEEIKDQYGDTLLYDESPETFALFKSLGVEKEMAKLKQVLSDYRVTFDIWFSESSLYETHQVEAALEKLKQGGYTYEYDGALWLKTTAFGDDKDRVLIKSNGEYTYLTPDISYHLNKLDRGYDHLIDLLGADHHGYIARMKAAIQALGYPVEKLDIDIIQMVRLMKNGEEVVMSKRTGNAVTIRDMMSEIGVDATRYFFASRAGSSMFDFDMDLALEQSSDNPVYYVQYAHARMCSIERASRDMNLSCADHFERLTHEKESDLLKHISGFKDVIVESAQQRAPHKIASYAHRLAALFHSFYNECKVLDEKDRELSGQRLALVRAARITLRNALNLIGVSAPERM